MTVYTPFLRRLTDEKAHDIGITNPRVTSRASTALSGLADPMASWCADAGEIATRQSQVEIAVQIVERFVLAKLRHRRFCRSTRHGKRERHDTQGEKKPAERRER